MFNLNNILNRSHCPGKDSEALYSAEARQAVDQMLDFFAISHKWSPEELSRIHGSYFPSWLCIRLSTSDSAGAAWRSGLATEFPTVKGIPTIHRLGAILWNLKRLDYLCLHLILGRDWAEEVVLRTGQELENQRLWKSLHISFHALCSCFAPGPGWVTSEWLVSQPLSFLI